MRALAILGGVAAVVLLTAPVLIVLVAALAAAKAKKTGGGYWSQRDAAYQVLRPHYDKVYAEFTPGLLQSVLGLIDRMIEVGRSVYPATGDA